MKFLHNNSFVSLHQRRLPSFQTHDICPLPLDLLLVSPTPLQKVHECFIGRRFQDPSSTWMALNAWVGSRTIVLLQKDMFQGYSVGMTFCMLDIVP